MLYCQTLSEAGGYFAQFQLSQTRGKKKVNNLYYIKFCSKMSQEVCLSFLSVFACVSTHPREPNVHHPEESADSGRRYREAAGRTSCLGEAQDERRRGQLDETCCKPAGRLDAAPTLEQETQQEVLNKQTGVTSNTGHCVYKL